MGITVPALSISEGCSLDRITRSIWKWFVKGTGCTNRGARPGQRRPVVPLEGPGWKLSLRRWLFLFCSHPPRSLAPVPWPPSLASFRVPHLLYRKWGTQSLKEKETTLPSSSFLHSVSRKIFQHGHLAAPHPASSPSLAPHALRQTSPLSYFTQVMWSPPNSSASLLLIFGYKYNNNNNFSGQYPVSCTWTFVHAISFARNVLSCATNFYSTVQRTPMDSAKPDVSFEGKHSWIMCSFLCRCCLAPRFCHVSLIVFIPWCPLMCLLCSIPPPHRAWVPWRQHLGHLCCPSTY